MKRLFAIAVALLLSVEPVFAGFPLKLNFRGTTGYVTADGAGENVVPSAAETSGLNGVTYPTSISGVNMGWDVGTSGTRDRSLTPPVQLAGIHINETANLAIFRIDLPSAGTYSVRLALGDFNQAWTTNKCEIFDNASSLLTINQATSAANRYLDANYNSNTTERTSANWATDNEAVNLTFATTTFFLKLGDGAGVNTGVISHLEITQLSTDETFGFYRRRAFLNPLELGRTWLASFIR